MLFCTRGNLPLRNASLTNWLEAERADHSRKPEVFYELVERASYGPFVEPFPHHKCPGWEAFGDEVASTDD